MLSNLIKSHQEHLPATLEEIGTNADQLKKDVASMREWYSYQSHLPQNIEDTVLASFIVGCKNSMEIAKMKIDMFYSERKRHPDIYSGCDPTSHDVAKSYKTVYAVALPSLTPDGAGVTIMKLRNTDPTLYSPLEPIKRTNMMLELLLGKTTMTSKTYLIYDYAQCTNAHVAHLNPLIVKTLIDTLRFLPIRVKGFIAINCPKIAERAYNLVQTFMSEKLRSRLFVYAEGVSALTKHIPAEMLPRDYGGQGDYTLESLNDYWHDTLVENRSWFVDESLHYSDESKRPADSKYRPDETVFGMDGTFKKLSID